MNKEDIQLAEWLQSQDETFVNSLSEDEAQEYLNILDQYDQYKASQPTSVEPSSSSAYETPYASGMDYGTPQSDVIDYMSAPYIPGRPEFTDRMTQEQKDAEMRAYKQKKANIEAGWDAMDRQEKAMYLSKLTGRDPADLADWIATAPYSALNYVMHYEMTGQEPQGFGGDVSTGVSGVKDIFSAPFRMAGAGLDVALSPTQATGEKFTESFSKRGGEMAAGEEPRTFVGQIGQSILRDPWNVPMMATGPGWITSAVEKSPVLSKAPRFVQKGVESGIKGGTEEVARGVVEGELDPTQMAMGTLFSGALGSVGDVLQQKALKKFKELPTKSAKESMGGEASPAYEKTVQETYEGLSPVGSDYNLPSRMKKLKSEQSRLGAMKEKAYRESEELADELGTRLPAAEAQWTGAEAFAGEKQRILDQVKSRNMSPSRAQEYADELAKVEGEYFDKLMEQGSEIAMLTKDTPTKEFATRLGYMTQDLKDAEGNLLSSIFGKDQVAQMQRVGKFYESDLIKLFNARKAMDEDLRRAYGKAGKGIKLTTKEDAYLFGRKTLNQMIDAKLAQIESEISSMPPEYIDIVWTPIKKALKESEGLPSLYRQEELIRSIGGGNIKKTTPSLANRTGILPFGAGEFLLPASGMRERQVGELLSNPLIQRQIKEQTYRNDENNGMMDISNMGSKLK